MGNIIPTNATPKHRYQDEVYFFEKEPERVPISKMNQQIHRLIGRLYSKNGNQSIQGTGILISPNLVLTAAHNLQTVMRVQQNGEKPILTLEDHSYITFCPGQNGDQRHPTYEVERCFFPLAFKQNKCLQNDYALLKLQRATPESKFIGLRSIVTMPTEDERVAIYGYPIIKDEDGTCHMYDQMGLTQSVNKNTFSIKEDMCQIQHKISTTQGQSGAPLILFDQHNNLSIIGIHFGAKKKETNCARLLNQEIIAELKRQAQHLGANMFQTILDRKYTEMGEALNKEHRWQLAEHCFNKALENNERRYACCYTGLGQALIAQKKYQEAYEAAANACRRIQRDSSLSQYLITALRVKGLACNALGQHLEAKACYDAILKLDPDKNEARLNLGSTLNALGDSLYEEGKKQIELSFSSHKNCPEYWNNLAYSLSRIEPHHDDIVDNYRRALKIDPQCQSARYNLAMVLLRRRSYNEAIKQFHELLVTNSMTAMAHNSLGICYYKLNNINDAITEFKEAIRLNCCERVIYDNYFECLQTEQQRRQALDFLLQVSQYPLEKELAEAIQRLQRRQ